MRHVVERNKPHSEPVLLILSSLAAGPSHGYALLQEIASLGGNRIRLSTGTLYGALHRLLEDRYIERFEQEDTAREKRAYRITSAGKKQLRAELSRIEWLLNAARRVMGTKGGLIVTARS